MQSVAAGSCEYAATRLRPCRDVRVPSGYDLRHPNPKSHCQQRVSALRQPESDADHDLPIGLPWQRSRPLGSVPTVRGDELRWSVPELTKSSPITRSHFVVRSFHSKFGLHSKIRLSQSDLLTNGTDPRKDGGSGKVPAVPRRDRRRSPSAPYPGALAT